MSSGEEPPAAKGACQTLQKNGAAGVVAMPGSKNYKSAISKSYNTLAQEEQPPCVVTPSSSAQVASLLREASARGASVTARGGGHTMRLVDHSATVWLPKLQHQGFQGLSCLPSPTAIHDIHPVPIVLRTTNLALVQIALHIHQKTNSKANLDDSLAGASIGMQSWWTCQIFRCLLLRAVPVGGGGQMMCRTTAPYPDRVLQCMAALCRFPERILTA